MKKLKKNYLLYEIFKNGTSQNDEVRKVKLKCSLLVCQQRMITEHSNRSLEISCKIYNLYINIKFIVKFLSS